MSTVIKNNSIFLEIKKVLVILTDGGSNTGQVWRPAQNLRNSGVVIFSVGVGSSLSMHQLRAMASQPADQHVITLNNFSELERLAEQMSSQTCNGKCNSWWDSGSGVSDNSISECSIDNGSGSDGK